MYGGDTTVKVKYTEQMNEIKSCENIVLLQKCLKNLSELLHK